MQPLLVKIPEAARMLGVSQPKLYRLLNEGKLTRIRLGPNATRIQVSEIRAFIAELAEADATARAQAVEVTGQGAAEPGAA